jgi:DNA-directed RNA polymerase specialized sigma24 family protein
VVLRCDTTRRGVLKLRLSEAVGLTARFSNPATAGHSVASSQNRAENGGRTTTSHQRVRQRQTRLPPPQIDDLVERRSAGATIAELAEFFDIHRTTVMAHLRRRTSNSP